MNAKTIRQDFPMFRDPSNQVIYLDNAATTQKPEALIRRIVDYYSGENANIHRGSYPLSNRASQSYEAAREAVRQWIGAKHKTEIVFTKSSTEVVNLLSSVLFHTHLCPGDNVVTTELEHSSNYFPWKAHCREAGVEFRAARAEPDGTLPAENVLRIIDDRTKLVAITGMSNVTGFRPDLETIISCAHSKKAIVYVDAAQMIAHENVSVSQLDCDLLGFSAHKCYGPMGVGVMYGKRELLESLSPYLYGGDMVIRREGGAIGYKTDPGKYEAGTQNIEGVLALEAALAYLARNHFPELCREELLCAGYLREGLRQMKGVTVLGADDPSPILSFTMNGLDSYDIGVLLGQRGISVRSGAHCAYPLLERMEKESTVRVSLGIYNTRDEIDLLLDELKKLASIRQ